MIMNLAIILTLALFFALVITQSIRKSDTVFVPVRVRHNEVKQMRHRR